MSYSPSQLQAASKIVSVVETMEQRSAELKQLLVAGALLHSRVYEIPRTKRADEGKEVDVIEPAPAYGETALRKGLNALTDWYGDPEFSTKIVNRTPGGLVFARIDEPAALSLIGEINRLKAEVESLTPELGSRDDRFELLHRHLPWVILTQLTRRILAIPSSTPLQSCRFTWGVKTEIKKVSRDEVCGMLEARRKRPKRTIDEVPWDVKVDREIAAIRSLPEAAELRWRRALRVRPLVNLRFYSIDDEQPETYLREAHTPALILNPVRKVTMGSLKAYSSDPGLRRERTKDRGTYERVSDILPVYLCKALPSPG